MSQTDRVPIYAADGASLGFRTLEAAQRLLAYGCVKPVYGRKRRLRALFLAHDDGGSPVEPTCKAGTRYIYRQRLANGLRCWDLKKLDRRDDDGVAFNGRTVFLQVVQDCLVP